MVVFVAFSAVSAAAAGVVQQRIWVVVVSDGVVM